MGMLDILIVLLILSWFVGFVVDIGGGFRHLIFVVAMVALIFTLRPPGVPAASESGCANRACAR